MNTKILIIDDHQLYREGIKRILGFEKSFEVVGEGKDGSEALTLVKSTKPDVVIMDVSMPVVSGIEATALLTEKYPNVKIIILSIYDDEKYVSEALEAGASGYLLKEMGVDSLIEAVKVVAEGGCYVHPKVTHNLVKEFRRLAEKNRLFQQQSFTKQKDIRRPYHILTRRECEILELLAEGKSNKKIGETLFISEKTVKNHVSNILQKMNCSDRTHAVVEAIKNGWVKVS